MSAELVDPPCQMWHLREIDTGHVLPRAFKSEGEALTYIGLTDGHYLYRVVQGGCTGDHIN